LALQRRRPGAASRVHGVLAPGWAEVYVVPRADRGARGGSTIPHRTT
jgi:hypothetical protein